LRSVLHLYSGDRGVGMIQLYGQKLDRNDVNRKFGSLSQFAGVMEYEHRSGKAKGTTVLDVRNGSGLRFSVLVDRGMDIGLAEFCGRPISWISRNGPVGSQFLDLSPLGFLRSFTGGLLTTCGLTQVGVAETSEEGDLLPFHGRIAHTPAERYSIREYWDEDVLVMQIQGLVRESRVYAENLLLEREISTYLGKNEIKIVDTVHNEGNRTYPLMLFYHINFGFPVVSEHSIFYTRSQTVWPLNDDAAKGDGNHQSMTVEQNSYPFQCFVHEMTGTDREIRAFIVNEMLDFGVWLEYSPSELPYFNHWKVMEMQDYVVAFEPGNCMPEGQRRARSQGRLEMLEPGGVKRVAYRLGIADGPDEVNVIREHMNS
jgi:hypothetical protein